MPELDACDGKDQCVVSRHAPYGNDKVFDTVDKPSSLLSIDQTVYAAMHYPAGKVTNGYLASSNDYGKTWKIAEGSPWKDESNFKTAMMINMGKAYSDNKDGFVYAMGVQHEADFENAQLQPVHLARVAKDKVLEYSSYEYYTGSNDSGEANWSNNESDSIALENLNTIVQGSAMYHSETGLYYFLTGTASVGEDAKLSLMIEDNSNIKGALYEAKTPWGPWHKVSSFPGGFIASLIPKDTSKTSFYFAAAGGAAKYNLNIHKMELELK